MLVEASCRRGNFTSSDKYARILKRCATLSLGVLIALPLMEAPVFAQDERGVPVKQRPRPDYDPIGVRAGSFLVFPKLTGSVSSHDNIFATQTNEQDDIIYVLTPSLNVRSDWNRHQLSLNGKFDVGRYADNGAEDYEDFSVGANGRLDVLRDTNIKARASFDRLHEDRGSPDAVNGNNPTEYDRRVLGIEGFQRFNRLNMTLGLTNTDSDYNDVTTSTGTIINNDDRDRNESELSFRLGYEIQPEYEAFLRLVGNQRDYDLNLDDGGVNRDSEGYNAVLGIRLDLSGVTTGSLFAGYLEQDYDDQALPTISGPSVGGNLVWNVTTLSTISLNATRTVQETTTVGSSGYIASRVGANLDHELLRNLLIGMNASYAISDYEGVNREDDDVGFGLYGKYMLNRNLHSRLSYDFRSRDSNVANSDYDQNILKFQLEVQF